MHKSGNVLTPRANPAQAPYRGTSRLTELVAQFLNRDAAVHQVLCLGRLRRWHPKATATQAATWTFTHLVVADSDRAARADALAHADTCFPQYSWTVLTVN